LSFQLVFCIPAGVSQSEKCDCSYNPRKEG
jgi:hypothetical protein